MLDELLDVPVLVLLGSLIDWQICESVKPCQTIGVLAGGNPSSVRREAGVRQQDCGLMTGTAFLRSHAVTLPVHVGRSLRGMPVVTLTGKVSVRVTVHTARMPQHGNKGCEERSLIPRGADRRLCGRGLFCSAIERESPSVPARDPTNSSDGGRMMRSHKLVGCAVGRVSCWNTRALAFNSRCRTAPCQQSLRSAPRGSRSALHSLCSRVCGILAV